ncbi:MAG: Unknown protein [uncultured Sulfurovum sp.]|uniref:Membrane protein insertion efficiency factor YidD n=1 Tax=uncultured Sulfurovum sp. TaxID=269237 RepID=A0A6S6U1Z3_9BACT|nr:MAG: Unknown protein [uncultured Sulfurovum sp.]
MLNYLRYFITLLLLYSLFYSYEIGIQKETLQEEIDLRMPMTIDKKGFVVTVSKLKIENIHDNVIESKLLGHIQANNKNIITKVFKSYGDKSIKLDVLSKVKPQIEGSVLSFKVLSLSLNNFVKIKEVNGHINKQIEKIEIPLKSLEKVSWLASIENIHFKNNDDLKLEVGISKWLLSLLISLFLLREIGLFFIYLYQRFLSPRKKYKCAKGVLYQNGTCSSTTKEAFKKHGFLAGMKEYRQSTKKCKEASQTLRKNKKNEGNTGLNCSSCSPNCGGGGGGSSSSCDCSPSCDVGGC